MVPPGLREAHQPEGSATTPGPDDVAEPRPRDDLAARVADPDDVAVGDAARRGVVGVQLEQRLALAGEVARQVGVGRVEEVVGALDGHERQRLVVARRRVEAGRQARRTTGEGARTASRSRRGRTA